MKNKINKIAFTITLGILIAGIVNAAWTTYWKTVDDLIPRTDNNVSIGSDTKSVKEGWFNDIYITDSATSYGLFSILSATTPQLSMAHTATSDFGKIGVTNGGIMELSDITGAYSLGDLSAGGSPGGSDTQIQFNNGGSFDASPYFIWDNTNLYASVSTFKIGNDLWVGDYAADDNDYIYFDGGNEAFWWRNTGCPTSASGTDCFYADDDYYVEGEMGISNDLSIGDIAADDDDSLYYDSRNQYLRWDDSETLFTLSNSFFVNGNATFGMLVRQNDMGINLGALTENDPYPDAALEFTSSEGNYLMISSHSTEDGNILSMTSEGLLGLWTNTPSQRFHLLGETDNSAIGPLLVSYSGTGNIGTALTLDAVGATGKIYSFISTGSAASSGAGDFAIYDGSDSRYVFNVDSEGKYIAGANQYTALGQITVYPFDTAEKGIVVKGNNSQTANLLELQNNGGGVLFAIDSNGDVGLADSSPDYALEIINTTSPQIAIAHSDAGNYGQIGVDSNGILEFTDITGAYSLGDLAASGSGDITDVYNCSSGDCASIAMADGDLLNASAVNNSGTSEGIILPQATDCSSGTAEGQICWDTDNTTLYIGNDGGVTGISGASPGGSDKQIQFNDSGSFGGSSYFEFYSATVTASSYNLNITNDFTCDSGDCIADADIPDTITASNYVRTSTWTDHNDYPSACTNQFVRGLGDTLTCATVDISGDTNLAVSGTLLDLTGDTLSVNEGTLTDTKLCTYASGSGIVCNSDDDDVPEVGDFSNLVGGIGIDNNSGTLDYDATEFGSLTFASGAEASFIWTFNLSAGDPTLTFGNDIFAVDTKFGINDTSPDYDLEIISSTSPQIAFAHSDGGNYGQIGVDTNGIMEFTDITGAYSLGDLASGGGTGDIEDVGDCSTGACFTADGTGNTMYFEGSSADAVEAIITVDDPTTSDSTFKLPDGGGSTYYFALDATSVTDLEGTGLAISGGTLNWSANLNDLGDVAISSATGGESLMFDPTASEWQNKSTYDPMTLTISEPDPAYNNRFDKYIYHTRYIDEVNCLVDPGDSSESVVFDVKNCDGDGDSCSSILSSTITCANTTTSGTISSNVVSRGTVLSIEIGTITGTISMATLNINSYIYE